MEHIRVYKGNSYKESASLKRLLDEIERFRSLAAEAPKEFNVDEEKDE